MDKARSIVETKKEERPKSGLLSGESGVFPGVVPPVAAEQLLERLQSALGVASKGESRLGAMQHSLRESTQELEASRQAHESLAEELRVLYRGLNELLSEKAGLERYAALLTQERDAALDAAGEARREAQQDRQFLLAEQDRFIQLLLEEHEEELARAQGAEAGSVVIQEAAAASESMAQRAVLASILPPPVEIGEASQMGQGDWDPQGWAVSSELLKDETFAQLNRESSVQPTAPVEQVKVKRATANVQGGEPLVDLASFAEEVQERNSDRPPPVEGMDPRQITAKLPALSGPSQWIDTLVSKADNGDRADAESDPDADSGR